MQLTEEEIREFSELWKLEFNETLSPGEAQKRASILLELYTRLASSDPERDRRPPGDPQS